MVKIITEKQFNYLWARLCDNYNVSYQKTEIKKKQFYVLLKTNSFKELDSAITKTILNNQYFPNMAEINNHLRNNLSNNSIATLRDRKEPLISYDDDGVMVWNGKRCEAIPLTDEEQQEMEDMIDELIINESDELIL